MPPEYSNNPVVVPQLGHHYRFLSRPLRCCNPTPINSVRMMFNVADDVQRADDALRANDEWRTDDALVAIDEWCGG